MVETARDDRPVTQNRELVGERTAAPGGAVVRRTLIRPVKALAIAEKNFVLQPPAPGILLPCAGEDPVQVGKDRVILLVQAARRGSVQIPQPEIGQNPGFFRGGGKVCAAGQIGRKIASRIGFKAVQADRDLPQSRRGEQLRLLFCIKKTTGNAGGSKKL